MNRKLSRSALAFIAIAVLLCIGLVATADTLNVPGTYETITAALVAASPGDTIVVAASYDPDVDGDGDVDASSGDETFPILVQKDNITIVGTGVTIDLSTYSTTGVKDPTEATIEKFPVFVVGALRNFDEATEAYVTVPVTGVTIDGFTIVTGDGTDAKDAAIGVLIKEASDVTVNNMTISDVNVGIRLYEADGCTLSNNTIVDVIALNNDFEDGFGILLEASDGNTLSGNTLSGCGVGLFLFESDNNTITGETVNYNRFGGVVLNDSDGNKLTGLTVTDNGFEGLDSAGWGIRFVISDDNALSDSVVAYNGLGGIELAGSQNNAIGGEWHGEMLAGNTVLSNGDHDDAYDDPQIVITSGDKAIIRSAVFEDYNELGDLPEFVEAKMLIYDKLDLLWEWLVELDLELEELDQKLTSAMTSAPSTLVDSINYELDIVQTSSGVLTRVFWEGPGGDHLPSDMTDPEKNFSLEAAKTAFDYGTNSESKLSYDELDWYEDKVQEAGANGGGNPATDDDDFGLKYDNDPDVGDEDEDQISLDKLTLIDNLISAIQYEVSNDWTGTGWSIENQQVNSSSSIDSLIERIEDLATKGLITAADKEDLLEKLNAILGWITDIQGAMTEIRDTHIAGARTDITDTNWSLARADILAAIEEKQAIYARILDIRYKLCLVDLELPPFPRVNSTLVGKKEKPFVAINTGSGSEFDALEDRIVDALNNDTTAKAIRGVVEESSTFTKSDLDGDPVGLRVSKDNLIANNLITSDLISYQRNVGIIIDGRENTLVNNLFTNEWIPELDSLLRNKSAADIVDPYAENLRLDVAILLYGDENTIVYNAFEYINTGMERGGSRKWKDAQSEYEFTALVNVGYWPGPGFTTPPSCGDGTPGHPAKQYTADHFSFRWTDYLPLLKVSSSEVIVDDTDTGDNPVVSIRVKRNNIKDNFWEYSGVAIYIVDAESNHIEQNLFYQSSNGGIVFGNGYFPNIILRENDYFGGLSVVAGAAILPVGADQDYTPAAGQDGHAPSQGNVNGPSNTGGPYAYDNFTAAKLQSLGIGAYFGTELEPLPPNTALFEREITLPEEKPRHPATIFEGEAPSPEESVCCDLEIGWNLLSPPVDPDNPDPRVVFADDPLYLCTYNTAAGDFEWVDKPPSATAGTAGALTTVGALGGYWLASEFGGQFCVIGTELAGDQVVDLATLGWYMIGVPYDTAWGDAAGAAVKFTRGGVDKWLPDAVAANWIYGTILSWDATAIDWDRVTVEEGTTLVPCLGYWIRTRVSGLTMTFTDAPWDPGNPPAFGTQSLKSEDPGNPPMPVYVTPLTFDASKLEFGNYPNPITDVHTTTFAVKGIMATFVDAIKVQIFDLSGRKVYEEETAGTSIDWHTDNYYGEYLANGVYLYKLYAKVESQWIVSELKKLAILR